MAGRRMVAMAIVGGLCLARAQAQTSYPMLMSVHPVAAQVGQSSEHTIKSRYSMLGTYEVVVSGEGVTAEVVPVERKEEDQDKPLLELRIRFQVASDARPGVRDFRLATPRGASTIGQLVIAQDAIVLEGDKNDAQDQAADVSLPATICGTIERNEDVDFYRFQAIAGERLSFHVRGQRLQDRIHDLQQHMDPILTLRDANGTTLKASDNFFFGDPFLSYEFPREGDYFLEIRDVRYQGNQYWEYSIEASERPLVRGAHPLGIPRGEATRMQLVGFQLPAQEAVVQLDPATRRGSLWWNLSAGGNPGMEVPLYVSDLPVQREGSQENNEPEQAEPVILPMGINGRIESEGDIDCYSFAAMKGEAYSFEVIARRRMSELDSQLRIVSLDGKQLTLNDDLRYGKRTSADSWIENWKAPADGIYCVEIRDLHLRGGEEFVYHLKATRSKPYFELFVDTDKTQLTPGTSGVIFVRAVRKNGFTGEIQLGISGLPQHVNAECGRILADGQDGAIVLTADAKAEVAISSVAITGKTDATGETLSAVALPYQETYQPGGGRGHWPVEMHSVAIGELADIRSVSLSQDRITLKPGESQKIDVTLERAEGFDKNILLDVTYNHLNSVYGSSLPPGVTFEKAASKTLLTGKEAAGHIVLKAAPDAKPVQDQIVPVMANVSLNFVMKATYAATPLRVSVVD